MGKLVIISLAVLLLASNVSARWFFGSGCNKKCKDAGYSSGSSYTSKTTGVTHCLCVSGTTSKLIPKKEKRSAKMTLLEVKDSERDQSAVSAA
jgi:hypothetical protein